MPNHVHLILAPACGTGLARAVGEAHRRYTAFVNARARQTGHLFQSRFASTVMDEEPASPVPSSPASAGASRRRLRRLRTQIGN